MSDTPDKTLCRTCVYRTSITGFGHKEIACFYIVVKGKERGCPIDRNCKRYVKGNPPKGKR